MGIRSTLYVSRTHAKQCLQNIEFDRLSNTVLESIMESLCDYNNFVIVDDDADDDWLLAKVIGAEE